jgi:hypothetical protein
VACHPRHADGGAADLKTFAALNNPPMSMPPAPQRSVTARTMGAIAALVYLSFFTTYRYGLAPPDHSGPEILAVRRVFCAGLVAHRLLV